MLEWCACTTRPGRCPQSYAVKSPRLSENHTWWNGQSTSQICVQLLTWCPESWFLYLFTQWKLPHGSVPRIKISQGKVMGSTGFCTKLFSSGYRSWLSSDFFFKKNYCVINFTSVCMCVWNGYQRRHQIPGSGKQPGGSAGHRLQSSVRAARACSHAMCPASQPASLKCFLPTVSATFCAAGLDRGWASD